jgi:hypothetical protein
MIFTLSRHGSIQPKIEYLKEKKLPGMQMSMSLPESKTGELWRNFMARKVQKRKTLLQKKNYGYLSNKNKGRQLTIRMIKKRKTSICQAKALKIFKSRMF